MKNEDEIALVADMLANVNTDEEVETMVSTLMKIDKQGVWINSTERIGYLNDWSLQPVYESVQLADGGEISTDEMGADVVVEARVSLGDEANVQPFIDTLKLVVEGHVY